MRRNFVEDNGRLKDLLAQLKEKTDKINNKPFIDKKSDELSREWHECVSKPMNDQVHKFVDLGQAKVIGYVLFFLNQEDLDKNDIKKILLSYMKDDVDMRSNAYGIWGDLEEDLRREQENTYGKV